MLKLVLTIVQALISIYWVGSIARQNATVNEVLSSIEKGYFVFSSRVQDASVQAVLRRLQRISGWAYFFGSVLLFIYFASLGQQYVVDPDTNPMRDALGNKSLTAWTYLLIISIETLGALLWFSLWWTTDHKTTVADMLWIVVLVVMGPTLFGIIDILFKSSIVATLAKPLYDVPFLLRLSVHQPASPLIEGFAVSLFVFTFFAFL